MRKNPKRLLIVSGLSLLLCLSLLVGSTFAWFTDTVNTGVNTIHSGSLDVSLVGLGSEGQVGFVDAKTGEHLSQVIWEPSVRFKLQPITVKNDGTLAAKCKVVISGTATAGTNLAEVIDVIKITGTEEQTLGTLKEFLEKGGQLGEEFTLNKKGDEVTINNYVLEMQSSVGNAYQDLTLDGLSITVKATQAAVESDSYNNQYDKGATYSTTAANAEEVIDAINAGTPVVLTSDITLDVAQYDVNFGTETTESITIDGAGHTITFQNDLEQARIYTKNPNAVLNISNATIARSKPTVGNYLTFLSFYCNTNLTNVKAAESINLWGVGKTYNLNNVEIVDKRTSAEHYAMFIKSGNTVTMDGCVFSNNEGNGNRAIKISDVNSTEAAAQALTKLTVKNTSFASDKKAAILIGTKYGADVTLENVDISNVAADSTNAVWVEDIYADYTNAIVVYGGTKAIEP